MRARRREVPPHSRDLFPLTGSGFAWFQRHTAMGVNHKIMITHDYLVPAGHSERPWLGTITVRFRAAEG